MNSLAVDPVPVVFLFTLGANFARSFRWLVLTALLALPIAFVLIMTRAK
jgi:hypothetical protein